MTLRYGFYKAKLHDAPQMQKKWIPEQQETQYHMHVSLAAPGHQPWDCAINVGTDDQDDLLRYRMVSNFAHQICASLQAAADGYNDLTAVQGLPALDFLRSDILTAGNETGDWHDSDVMNDSVMDSTSGFQPVAALEAALRKAADDASALVYAFGRTYTHGGVGIHDIHMNQGSTGTHFRNNKNDHNDHNDVWQDGAIIIGYGDGAWTAYFTAFTKQVVPTDDLGNPEKENHEINNQDPGSLSVSVPGEPASAV